MFIKTQQNRKRKTGFTLIELLTVIAIIGILAGILIPAVGAARRQVDKAKTRAVYGNWMQALTEYKNTYGFYPKVLRSGSFNLSDAVDRENFIRSLTGKEPDGSKMSDENRRANNRKAKEFYTFTEAEFDEFDRNVIVDAFGNPNIYIVVDIDDNGLIEESDLEGTAKDRISNEGLRAKIVVYSLANDNPDYVDIFSWD